MLDFLKNNKAAFTQEKLVSICKKLAEEKGLKLECEQENIGDTGEYTLVDVWVLYPANSNHENRDAGWSGVLVNHNAATEVFNSEFQLLEYLIS